MKLVKKWLKDMPRPSTLTFAPVHVEEDDEEEADAPAAPALNSNASARSPEVAGTPRGGDAIQGGPAGDTGSPERSALQGAEADGASQHDSADMQALIRLAAEWQQQDSEAEAAQ